jgi:hypothetical protein
LAVSTETAAFIISLNSLSISRSPAVLAMKATVQQLIDTRARSRLFRRKCCCQEKSAKSFSLVTIALVMAAYAYVVVRQLSRFFTAIPGCVCFVARSQPAGFTSARQIL